MPPKGAKNVHEKRKKRGGVFDPTENQIRMRTPT